MDSRYHIEIIRAALGDQFSETDLQAIIRANLAQDRLNNLIGHPEIHFDDNEFAASEHYLRAQRQQAVAAAGRSEHEAMLAALGRLLHGRQDFYAHSNWIPLAVAERGGTAQCSPADMPLCLDPTADARLRSGRGVVWHFLAVRLPVVGGWIERQLIPADSHERMNLDNPGRGPLFAYAMAAAIRHTRLEWDTLAAALTRPEC
ncbi:MAG: hypothetical protein ABTQ73_06285 [Caldilineales bacterium]